MIWRCSRLPEMSRLLNGATARVSCEVVLKVGRGAERRQKGFEMIGQCNHRVIKGAGRHHSAVTGAFSALSLSAAGTPSPICDFFILRLIQYETHE